MVGHWLVLGLATCLVGLSSSQQDEKMPAQQIKPEELTLEKLFRTRSYAGQQARGVSFSHQDRYLAYLWNPYGENGTDLYIYDTQNGQTKRVTSLDLMKSFDAPETIERFQKKAADREKQLDESQAKVEAQAAYLEGSKIDLDKWDKAAIEVLKKEADKKQPERTNNTDRSDTKKTDDSAKQEKEKEFWEWRDELKKKQEKDSVKVGDTYPGVTNFNWAHRADELIFSYRGDLFRYTIDTEKTDRLTNTDRTERLIGYTPGDDGYIFQDGTSIFSVNFNSGRQVQLNRALVFGDDATKKYNIQNTTLSEDGKWMAIGAQLQEEGATGGTGGRGQGQGGQSQGSRGGRQVQIMDYTKRFAESKQVQREVSDDRLRTPATAIYIRKVDEAPTRQPDPIFTNDGGDVWFERTPISFSKDGSKYTFATWEREKDILKVYMGNTSETKKPEVVIERKGDVGHEVVTSLAPRFTPDGKTLVVVLDEQTGFRQPWAMDVATKSFKPVLKGHFEAHTILGFTPDSASMFLLANKDDFAAMNVYQVSITSGAIKLVGKAGDYHRNPSVSENGTKVAMNSGNWIKRNELHVVDIASKDIKTLTNSHDLE
ncbi:MAG: DPP IV N-terminal domain-containing protein, partial [Holophagales bacterium]|nr:DPP IV N-terminal domain-containing protein [Holophagales bacterium]